jgi:peroxiredoxin
VEGWQRDYADRLSIALIGRGDFKENQAKASQHNVRNFLLQVDDEIAKLYQAEGTPTAVLIRKGKIASPIASGADDVHSLVYTATLPPPLAQGDLAPELELPDLDGGTLDLGRLRGHRHLLLFWNPECGFCQGMLGDIKAWESDPSADAPRLLVVSTGAPEANRAQGFRAPIVLDQSFRAGQLFGVSGTPAAVILDEEGRVASDPGVGSVEVMALAGGVRHGVEVH